MDQKMAELRDRVTTDWRVKIIDHLYSCESRDDVKITSINGEGIVLKPRKAWGSQGMRFPTTTFTWEKEGDVEVDGNTVRIYVTHTGLTSRTRPGQRECARTYTFIPPVV